MQHTITIRNGLGDTITSPIHSILRIERNNCVLVIHDGAIDPCGMTFPDDQAAMEAEAIAIHDLGEYLSWDMNSEGVEE